MAEIIAVGDEDFTLGFELVGIRTYPVSEFDKLIQKNSEAGILIVSQRDYDVFPQRTKMEIDRLLKPLVVILSKEDIKGGNLREAIIKALGVDLLKEN